MSQPFLDVLVWLEHLLRSTPWWIVVAVTIAIAWSVSRRIGLSVAMGALLCVIGLLGLWDGSMQTLALMILAAGLSVIYGIPVGVLMARANWLRSIMLPLLDVMQTMPSFVYLIPVVMLRSEEHTSELQSLMRISYAVFCLKKKKKSKNMSATHELKQSQELEGGGDVPRQGII